MRICQFDDHRLGLVVDDRVADITDLMEGQVSQWPPEVGDPLILRLADIMRRAPDHGRRASSRALSEVALRSPVSRPGKIIGAPVNYREHIAEASADPATFFPQQLQRIQTTGLFLKASSSLVGPADGIALRHPDRRTDHEVELAVVIGVAADRVSRGEALRHVAGYAVALDMTVRGPEERSFRKSVDSYSVLGPWLVTADEIPDPSDLQIELRVNGDVRQRSSTRELVIDVPGLIEMASHFYTLHPGDVIMTGTPAGVGPVMPGDLIQASIDKLGAFEIAVRAL